ncbi:MAG: MASE3 domain-containing protein, partial [Desulfosalsimonas sp.]|uniref:sensor histidine kinase n=1 Tax=Desulfosalsimonas sp. TaxID=3073848 RepID=UPI003970E1A4
MFKMFKPEFTWLKYASAGRCQPSRTGRRPSGSALAAAVLVLIVIYLTAWYSYLLFHSVVETFAILVSFSIFLFSWNTLPFSRQRYLAVLGIAYLFVGALDMAHMLSYKGMGVIVLEGADYATQTWIAARYMESISLLVLPFLFHRKADYRVAFAAYGGISLVLFLSIFVFPVFPKCYVQGAGLTPFKVISEYIICGILIAAGAALYRQRKDVDPVMFKFLMAALAVTAASEMAFTQYVSVYGPANQIGHMLKLISSYLIYRAIVARGLLSPYQSMFRELERSRKALERYSRSLENRVAERTRELEESNRELRYLSGRLVHAEEKERRRIARDLHDSIGQTLSAIKLTVENAAEKLGQRVDQRHLKELETLVPMARTAIDEVRRIIMDLRPPVLEKGVLHTIGAVCRDFDRLHPDIRVETRLSVTEDQVPEDVKVPVFRLLQEALHNIDKHSNASRVQVIFSLEADGLCFEVADDGKGFDLQAA